MTSNDKCQSQTSLYPIENKVNNMISDNVNNERGIVEFQYPLINLNDRQGIGIHVTALYQSNIDRVVHMNNLKAPTSVLGLGWHYDFERIELSNEHVTDTIKNQYHLYDGRNKITIEKTSNVWKRGALLGMIDNKQTLNLNFDSMNTLSHIRDGLLEQHIEISNTIRIVSVNQNEWRLEDDGLRYVLILKLIDNDLHIYDGGIQFNTDDIKLTRIIYYKEYERWVLTYTNGNSKIYGDTQLQYGICIEIGAKPLIKIQKRYVKAWNLLYEQSGNSMITYEYSYRMQAIKKHGMEYTKACYITKIIDTFGHYVLFDYKEKEYDKKITYNPREYIDPHKVIPTDEPDMHQSCYNTKYLASICCYQEQRCIKKIHFIYRLRSYRGRTSQNRTLHNEGKYYKRILTHIQVINTDTIECVNKPIKEAVTTRFIYNDSIEANKGALKQIKYPEGATVSYLYNEDNLVSKSIIDNGLQKVEQTYDYNTVETKINSKVELDWYTSVPYIDLNSVYNKQSFLYLKEYSSVIEQNCHGIQIEEENGDNSKIYILDKYRQNIVAEFLTGSVSKKQVFYYGFEEREHLSLPWGNNNCSLTIVDGISHTGYRCLRWSNSTPVPKLEFVIKPNSKKYILGFWCYTKKNSEGRPIVLISIEQSNHYEDIAIEIKPCSEWQYYSEVIEIEDVSKVSIEFIGYIIDTVYVDNLYFCPDDANPKLYCYDRTGSLLTQVISSCNQCTSLVYDQHRRVMAKIDNGSSLIRLHLLNQYNSVPDKMNSILYIENKTFSYYDRFYDMSDLTRHWNLVGSIFVSENGILYHQSDIEEKITLKDAFKLQCYFAFVQIYIDENDTKVTTGVQVDQSIIMIWDAKNQQYVLIDKVKKTTHYNKKVGFSCDWLVLYGKTTQLVVNGNVVFSLDQEEPVGEFSLIAKGHVSFRNVMLGADPIIRIGYYDFCGNLKQMIAVEEQGCTVSEEWLDDQDLHAQQKKSVYIKGKNEDERFAYKDNVIYE